MKSCRCFVLIGFLLMNFLYGSAANMVAGKLPEDSSRFSLILSFYNHAELVYKGSMTYHITEDYLGISRHNLFEKKKKPVYSANIRKAVSDSLISMNLDTLSYYYYNYCIMSTSGNEYFISIENNGTEKRTYLHHYYHPQVERLIHIINALVPEEYRISYMKQNTKQDCK